MALANAGCGQLVTHCKGMQDYIAFTSFSLTDLERIVKALFTVSMLEYC